MITEPVTTHGNYERRGYGVAKRLVRVSFMVEVETDDSKFTPEFMKEYRELLYNFDTIDEHAEHIAQLAVRGLLDRFTEGYGWVEEMGISAEIIEQEEEVEEVIND
jgi:hypothetical protein